MSRGLYLPGAKWRPISYRGEAGKFTHEPLGWILHVAVMNGSPFNVFEKAKSPNRRFSHGWVAKDGSSEQYQTLDMKSWAQTAGNGDYWSFETEGYPEEPLTLAQQRTLATWHNYLGTPDLIVDKPGGRGIGTHYMGGAAYGGHSCPDPVGKEGKGPRSLQRDDIIRIANGGIMATLDADDKKWLLDNLGPNKVWTWDGIPSPQPTPTNPNWTPSSYLLYGYQNIKKILGFVDDPHALASELASLLPSGSVTPEELEAALRNIFQSVPD